MRQAASGLPPELLRAVDAEIAGSPLDAEAERARSPKAGANPEGRAITTAHAPNSLAALRERHGETYRWRVLLTVMIGTMASIMASTIVNVAVPDMSRISRSARSARSGCRPASWRR
jgi:hypothetical protein